MENNFETKEIIELLKLFLTYKKENIKYLNSKIGSILKYQELDCLEDNVENKKTYNLILTITNVDKNWIENNFYKTLELLDNKQENKILILEQKNLNKIKYLNIHNYKNFQKIKENEFSFECEITINKKEKIDKIIFFDLKKQDINEIFKVKFLTRIKENLNKDGILSKEVQKILLNQKKISNVNYDFINVNIKNDLDVYQSKAFQASISKNDILIIKGPPGTGKSKLISEILKYYSSFSEEQVIVASQTHYALENIIDKITITKNNSNEYSGIIWSKTSKGINSNFIDKNKMLTKNIRNRFLQISKNSNNELNKLLKTTHNGYKKLNRFIPNEVNWFENTIFTTLFSRGLENIREKNPKEFEKAILIIDEVSKLSIIDVLRFSMNAKKIILIGDDMQLPPIIDNSFATKNFKNTLKPKLLNIYKHLFEDSIFYKIYDENFKDNIYLKNSYRNPKHILRLYNKFFYKNKIISNKKNIENFNFKDNIIFNYYKNKDLILVDNSYNFKKNIDSHINQKEIEKIKKHLKYLYKNLINKKENEIMILFMYNKQKDLFKKELKKEIIIYKKNYKSFKFGTIDEMQGQEANIVYILTTMTKEKTINTNSFKYINILQSKQRINVALSRSKSKIILIADVNYLKNLEIWDTIKKEKTKVIWIDILKRFQKLIKEVKFYE